MCDKFERAIEELEYCYKFMGGWDQHHRKNPSNWKDYMLSSEYYDMKELIKICRKIIKDVDNGDNVFYKGDD